MKPTFPHPALGAFTMMRSIVVEGFDARGTFRGDQLTPTH
jgi:hypothetical protein